ncbi:sensor histidine kinase [Seonamhaeicola sp.]|uniref:tetratricopeptide repeat-containing sensor histidine kinase n=1 Tax=Seonamhaeicola sp. TaxID=1912245 RepID=UPI002606E763|nr:sensor histidine kinase [Seonamhaeicola sp.]
MLLPVLFLVTGFCVSQESDYDKVENYLNRLMVDSAEVFLNKNLKTGKSIFEKAQYSYYNGIILKRRDRHDLGFEELTKALIIFKQIDSLKHLANTYYEICDLLLQQNNLDIDIEPYADEYYSIAKKFNDPLMLARAYSKYASLSSRKDDFDSTISYYKKTIEKLKIINDTLRIAIIETNIGSIFYGTKKDSDSALYFYKKSLPVFKKYKIRQYVSNNYNNQAKAYELAGDHNKALEFYELTKDISLNEYNIKTQEVYYDNQLKNYKALNDFENAFLSAEKLLAIKDSINNTEQNIAISEIKEQYDNEKLRADNLESESKRKQAQNLLFGSLVLLGFGGITFFLIQKNTKRKQKLAEQEKALESQKLATVLKEQELLSIDAMIEGQEKERQRIANDLHDDLGGLMATVKLHFNALKDKQTPELYDKTTTLLDEAYQKIRSIAHAKNSGVIAKQGLLKAVNQMAEKVSAANKITIDVIDHGLENRLENSLELTIFRIIQELVTNIIKHANATEATIHLTNHEETLNIMVEDNGKGFNPSQITTRHKGMGISSIDKRVEHLNGTMTIESELKKGTTVIIDIPI